MVALWNARNFTATKRTIIASLDSQGHLLEKNNPTLEYISYNRQTQAIGIHAGPQFEGGYTVSFFDEPYERGGPWYRGRELCLPPGVYPNLEVFGFAKSICGVRFNERRARAPGLYEGGQEQGLAPLLNPDPKPAQQIPRIPLVVRLITDDIGPDDAQVGPGGCGPYTNGGTSYPCELWRCLTLVEDAPDFRTMFGDEYDATTIQVIVQKGPDYGISKAGFEARLYEGVTGNDPDRPANLDFGPDDDTVPPSGSLVGVAKGNFLNLYTPPWEFSRRARAMRIVGGDVPAR